MKRSQPPARNDIFFPLLLLLCIGLVVVTVFVHALPLVLPCIGISLLLALVFAAVTMSRTEAPPGTALQRTLYRLRELAAVTLLTWFCGLILAGGAITLLPGALLTGMKTIKRRLVLYLYRRQAALPEVTVASLPELRRLRPGRRFVLTAEIARTAGGSKMVAGVDYPVFDRSVFSGERWSISKSVKQGDMRLALSGDEITVPVRSVEIVVAAPEKPGEPVPVPAEWHWLAIYPGEAVTINGQVALLDDSKKQEPRYHAARLTLLSGLHGLTHTQLTGMYSPHSAFARLLNPGLLSTPPAPSAFAPGSARSVPRLPPEYGTLLRDADIDGDPE